MNKCVFCKREAKYQFKNNNWCCENSKNKCPEMKRRNSNGNKGKKRPDVFRKKMSELMKGEQNHMFGTDGYWKNKKRSQEDIKKFRISHKDTIESIKEKYPFFSKIEEMRYNPDKLEEKQIQVHCKNHTCLNSKENNGWFTPVHIQLYERIRALEKPYGMIENNFYCSEECKNICPLYNLKNDPNKIIKKNYNQEEYQTFRNFVLERDKYICQFCGEKAVHVHHERPQKLEPFFSLDPDYAWSCCKKCHYNKGHRDECSTGNLSTIMCK